jgi:sigma-E factor negative regulatory protein RseC
MTQTVRVVEIVGKNLCSVEMIRESACGGNCASCDGCTAAGEKITALAYNAAGAEVNDIVIVESRRSDIYGIAALVYMVPVLLLMIGYFLADALFGSPYAPGAGAALGFAAGIFMAVVYAGRKKGKVFLSVTKILQKQ